MSLRNKKRQSSIVNRQIEYSPTIGIINPITSLGCLLQPHTQQFKYNLSYKHPLQTITRLSMSSKKYAFQKLLQATFEIKVQQKTTFLPEALLNGNEKMIHEFSKMLQKGRVDSYIKLNIKHKQRSLEKKRSFSHDTGQNNYSYIESQKISQNIFNENIINQRTVKKVKKVYMNQNNEIQNRQVNKVERRQYLDMDLKSNNNKMLNSFSQIGSEYKKHQHYLNSNINITENHVNSRVVNHTVVLKKSKSKKKQNSGIKVSYMVMKKDKQNPQATSFVFKSNLTHKRQKSSHGPKTEILNGNFNQKLNQTYGLNNDNTASFSVNNEQFSQTKVVYDDHNDNLSERYHRSIKNSEKSELTHNNEVFGENYFYNDKKILKKGRKSIYIQEFQN